MSYEKSEGVMLRVCQPPAKHNETVKMLCCILLQAVCERSRQPSGLEYDKS